MHFSYKSLCNGCTSMQQQINYVEVFSKRIFCGELTQDLPTLEDEALIEGYQLPVPAKKRGRNFSKNVSNDLLHETVISLYHCKEQITKACQKYNELNYQALRQRLHEHYLHLSDISYEEKEITTDHLKSFFGPTNWERIVTEFSTNVGKSKMHSSYMNEDLKALKSNIGELIYIMNVKNKKHICGERITLDAIKHCHKKKKRPSNRKCIEISHEIIEYFDHTFSDTRNSSYSVTNMYEMIKRQFP